MAMAHYHSKVKGEGFPPMPPARGECPDPNQPHEFVPRRVAGHLTGGCAHCPHPATDPLHTQQTGTGFPGLAVPLSQWTDVQVLKYVAFVLEGCAHLQGGLGALKAVHLIGLADRLKTVAGAHGMNVRDKTNWAAGPR
jgi:hypothetical protein